MVGSGWASALEEIVPQAICLRDFLMAPPFSVPADVLEPSGSGDEREYATLLEETMAAPCAESEQFWRTMVDYIGEGNICFDFA